MAAPSLFAIPFIHSKPSEGSLSTFAPSGVAKPVENISGSTYNSALSPPDKRSSSSLRRLDFTSPQRIFCCTQATFTRANIRKTAHG